MPKKRYWRKASVKRREDVVKQEEPAMKKRKVSQKKSSPSGSTNDCAFKVCVQGTFHQGDQRFSVDSLGRQCTCNSLVSLCCLSEKETFASQDLDFVLEEGDKLYVSLVDTLKKQGKFTHNYLELSQLPRQVTLQGSTHNITMLQSMIDVFNTGILVEEEVERLCSKVESALQMSTTALVLLGEYALALFRDTGGKFVVFDSHSRNDEGFPCADGTSILVHCNTISLACDHLVQLAAHFAETQSISVEILPVVVQSMVQNKLPDLPESHVQSSESMKRYFADQLTKTENKKIMYRNSRKILCSCARGI